MFCAEGVTYLFSKSVAKSWGACGKHHKIQEEKFCSLASTKIQEHMPL